MFFKGMLASLAGPAPNYDMQRVLATRNPARGLHDERHGLLRALLPALHDDHRHHRAGAGLLHARAAGHGEARLREAAADRAHASTCRPGVVGLLLAGLLAAFMSNFAATINAAPAYLVNDIYKRFINPQLVRRRPTSG